jgi:hypothetical protein
MNSHRFNPDRLIPGQALLGVVAPEGEAAAPGDFMRHAPSQQPMSIHYQELTGAF